MEGTARRVSVFFGAGVVLAALVGFTVWATSTPGQNNRAGFTADAAGTSDPSSTAPAGRSASSPTTATVTEDETRTVRSSSNQAREHGRQAAAEAEPRELRHVAGAAPSGYNAERDPYMPPHAVVAPAPGPGQPPRVYRPSNIVPSPAPTAAPQGTARPSTEPTSASGHTSSRTPASEPGGNSAPGTGAPPSGTPATPAPGGSETPPTEPAEPTGQPAVQPPSRPQEGANPGSEPGAVHEGQEPPTETAEQAAQGGPAGTAQRQEVEPRTANGADRGASEPAAPAQPAAAQPPATPNAPAAQTRVPGKEDVAGYPHENKGMTPRDVIDKIDKFTGRAGR